MAGHLSFHEAMVHRRSERRFRSCQRNETLAKIAECGHPKQLTKASAGAAIISHRHDGGDGRGVLSTCAKRDGGAVASTEGDHRWTGVHRSMSRWNIEMANPSARSRVESSSLIATDRWWPPVQPMPIVR